MTDPLEDGAEEGSGCNCSQGCRCCCVVTLPQPHRPTAPVDYTKYEWLECFPCFFDSTWPFQKLPFLKWMLGYRPRWLLSDVIAGLTVGLMVVPQALAYANIAKLPPVYGLYSSFMGCFVYMLFGTSKDITLGPTAILSLLTASLTEPCGDQDSRIACAMALTFLSGAIQLAVGLVNLGFLVDFIPVPVISGFTSAAAITIALGQVKHLLGIEARRSVVDAIHDIFANIKNTNGWDVLLGVCCILLVISLKLLKMLADRMVEKRKGRLKWPFMVLYKVVWLICTARNAVVVFLAAIVGFVLTRQDWFDHQISLIESSNASLPSLRLPNPTKEVLSNIGVVGLFMAPLISFLESIAIAKAFARKNGYKVEPSQELFALGMCNLASSFVGSYPVTGSFSRTAVNAQSGVQTPAAGIVTGTVVILALWLLSGVFHYIPQASLAAIIIAAVIPVVDVRIVWKIFRLRFIDVLPLIFSFCFTLFLGIEYGVPIAMGLYVLILLYRHARPRHEVQVLGKTVIMRLIGGWTYPGVNYILKRTSYEVTSVLHADREKTNLVVFECTEMPDIDYTVVQELHATIEDLQQLRITVCIVGAQEWVGEAINTLLPQLYKKEAKPQVLSILQKANMKDVLFYNKIEELSLSTIGDTGETSLLAHPLRGTGGSQANYHSIQRSKSSTEDTS